MKRFLASLTAVLTLANCSSLREFYNCLEEKLPQALTEGCRKEENPQNEYILRTLQRYDADPEVKNSLLYGNYSPAIAFLRKKEPSSDPHLLTSLGISYLHEAETNGIFHLSPTPEECRAIYFDYERALHYLRQVPSTASPQERGIEELLHQAELKTREYSTCPQVKLRQPPIDPAILK